MKFILLLMPVCLLSACALEPKRSEPPVTRVIVQPALPAEAEQLLAYLTHTRKLDAREFAAERERSRNAFQGDKSEFNRVKLALLLVPVPASPPASAASANATDDGDLIALLEPLVRNTAASAAASMAVIPVPVAPVGMRALAMLLYGMAQDRQKLREHWREAQVRLNAMRRDDSKEVEARALRARVEDLERKLAALKSIDRSVNRRSEAQRGAAPGAEGAR